MARDNPKIDLSKPIPLSLLGGRGDSEGGDSEEAPEDEPLVPDFTDYKTASPPPGFGKAGELFSVKIQESDQREASERLNRYDRNRDGALDEGELRGGRWQDNPMQYDRNQDGKLQTSELAVRFAKIRLAGAKSEGGRQDENQDRRGAGGWGAWGGGGMGDSAEGDSKEEPAVELWQNRSTFRLDSKETKVQSLPNWFTALDADSDNQVRMQEFTSDWNDAQISEFRLFDLNDDGVISSKECLTAIRNGVIRGTGGTSTSTAAVGQSTASSGRSNAIDSAINELPPEAERWKKFIAGRMIKLDNNKNGNLTGDEWAASEGADFNTVDKDRDGTITVLEFYQFRANK
jgi:Ca2+-binding EF-hand superfamily protein